MTDLLHFYNKWVLCKRNEPLKPNGNFSAVLCFVNTDTEEIVPLYYGWVDTPIQEIVNYYLVNFDRHLDVLDIIIHCKKWIDTSTDTDKWNDIVHVYNFFIRILQRLCATTYLCATVASINKDEAKL